MSRVTIKDVADRAGVSSAAISQALNDRGNLSADTRARIKAVARELGYIPHRHAAALRRGRTMTVGFVMADDLEDPTGNRILHRMRQLQALVTDGAVEGFTVTMLPARHPELLHSTLVDVLYLPDASHDTELLRDAVARDIPVVATDLLIDAPRAMAIRTGYDDALRAALDHLAASGAERIGLLVDDGGYARDEIARTTYRSWSTVRERDVMIAEVDPDRRTLVRRVRDLLERGADAIVSFCEEGPEVYLELEASSLVIPRDVQLIAMATSDCALNERLGVSYIRLHPEMGPTAMFARMDALATSGETLVVDLPWEFISGSTTRH